MNIPIAYKYSITLALLLVAAVPARMPAQGGGLTGLDKEPLPATLTIDQAVKVALERNTGIALAQSKTETNEARVNGAFGAFLPQVTVTGGYTRQLYNGSSVSQFGSALSDNSYNVIASASISLFDGFARSSAYRGAQSAYNASAETMNSARKEIAAQTRMAFISVLRAEQIIEIRKNDLESLNDKLKRAQGLVDGGVALQLSVYPIEAEIANTELSIEQARTDATVARHALNLLLNFDPVAQIALSSEGLASSVDSAEIASSRSRLGSLNDMLARQAAARPDLKAAQLLVDVADASLNAAKADYYPSVTAGTSYAWQKNDLLSTNNFSLDISFRYNLFDGFRTKQNVVASEAQKLSVQFDLKRLQLQARSDLESALARLDGAVRQIRAADKAVYAARQSRFAADERFKGGVGTYTDYLLANTQYLTAQINQVNSVFGYRAALFEVLFQLGE